MQLSPDQEATTTAFMNFLDDPTQNEMVIAGYPGCGKSFLTKHLIDTVHASNNLYDLLTDNNDQVDVICTATTNKAAAVLEGMSGQESKTIHSVLGLKVKNNTLTGETNLHQTQKPTIMRNNLIIIDEASYVNKYLLEIIRESTENCKVLYIGDEYQLTDIKEKDCPVFNITNKSTLSSSQRFSRSGPIAQLAEGYRTAIDTGVFPRLLSDGKEILRVDGPTFQSMINNDYAVLGQNNVKVVAWTNRKVQEYNNYIRQLHTPSEAFLLGESVITNKPIPYIAGELDNGNSAYRIFSTESQGIITDIYEGEREELEGWHIQLDNKVPVFQARYPYQVKELTDNLAKLKHWPEFFRIKDSFGDLRAVHACTVYKSQGSTYDTVYVDLADIGKCHIPTTVARMLHVAITRASNRVVLYGELPYKYRG